MFANLFSKRNKFFRQIKKPPFLANKYIEINRIDNNENNNIKKKYNTQYVLVGIVYTYLLYRGVGKVLKLSSELFNRIV